MVAVQPRRAITVMETTRDGEQKESGRVESGVVSENRDALNDGSSWM